MKKIVCTILSAMTAFTFADEYPITPPLRNDSLLPSETAISKSGFFYVRFSTAENDLIHTSAIVPGLGLGYRRLSGNGAADISLNGIGQVEKKRRQILWTAPKVSYIHYLQPNGKKSAYMGGGMAWGGTSTEDNHFVGIIPNAVIGYEFVHKGSLLGFTELNISQPAIALYREGFFPGPIAEISIGVGF